MATSRSASLPCAAAIRIVEAQRCRLSTRVVRLVRSWATSGTWANSAGPSLHLGPFWVDDLVCFPLRLVHRPDCGLGPVRRADLAKDRSDGNLHGRLGKLVLARDEHVGGTLLNAFEDVHLST